MKAEALTEAEQAAEKSAKRAEEAGAPPAVAADIGAKAAIEEAEKPKPGTSGSPETSAQPVQISTTKKAFPAGGTDTACACQEDWTFKGKTYHYCDPRSPESE